MSAKKAPAKKAATITPEIADKLRSAQISNIVKKVRDGKTLTAAESRMLEVAASPDDDQLLVTLTRISDLYHISRKTIYEWRKNGKDVPKPVGKKEDLTAWRAWFAANPSAGHFDGKPRADRESLLCQKLEVEIECKKIELKKLEDTCIDMIDAQNAFYKLGAVMRAGIMRMQADLPPMMEGQSPSGMARIIGESAEKILTELSLTESELWQAN